MVHMLFEEPDGAEAKLDVIPNCGVERGVWASSSISVGKGLWIKQGYSFMVRMEMTD